MEVKVRLLMVFIVTIGAGIVSDSDDRLVNCLHLRYRFQEMLFVFCFEN